ncbi:TonB-dependent receptor plug domain-containing protein [Lutibacter citreus]|uniref:TonB-dependent receptor plug domain-containing protein n=1 Tax=Lutibacter citreus TaxID=2138210 RepID=UPI00130027BC|nr:TonB-dependent receptor plug domain-containing protein [Lutibacter citreus]
MNLKRKIFVFILVISAGLFTEVSSQENKVYNDMTLDEILNIDVVVTASKHPEDLFETPLSTTIISKEEIEKSGVTSIPEALRFVQGVIVREITPGNYDIHIRGYDDITKNAYVTLPYNTTTLVMIDNRVVYSYFSGGTFWETFPIDIIDVERIEVVRGPASALYGPNAVTGVINIITSHANKKGRNVSLTSIVGTNYAKNASVNIGYNWDDKTKLSFSGNFTERYRFNDEYYDFNKKGYTDIEDLTMFVCPGKDENTNEDWKYKEYQEALGAYYDVDLSLRKLGGNIFLLHNFSENSNIDVAVGAQKSQSQKTGFLNFSTPLSQSESESYYLNTRIKHKNLSGQFNLNSGHDNNNYKFNSYKFTNIEGNLEYFKQFKSFSIRPGISFKHLSYNSSLTYNEPLDFNKLNYKFKDEPRETSSYSAFILTEWNPISNLRMIGAIRHDKFEFNKNCFTNFELATTYRINKNNLIRAVYSKANKSPFFLDSYMNAKMSVAYIQPATDTQSSLNVPVNLNIKGQADLKYPTIINQEIGWRTKINSNLKLDVELFYSKVDNFVNTNIYRNFKVEQQLNALGEPESIISLSADGDAVFENYDLKADQFGVGFTLNYEFSNTFRANVFGTYQITNNSGEKDISIETTNIHFDDITPDNILVSEVNTIMNPVQWSSEVTPSFFGGFLLNYKPNKKWNFCTDANVYSNQVFTNYNYYKLNDITSIDEALIENHIKANIILNAKAFLQLNKNTSSSLTIKNILGNHLEYGFADQIGRQLLIGIKWEL